MTKHTAGPWKVDGGELIAADPDDGGAWVIGQVYGADDYPCPEADIDEECKANARLIAAAPDLLAALRALVATAHECYFAKGIDGTEYHLLRNGTLGYRRDQCAVCAARAAIAKASPAEIEGESAAV